MTQYQVTAACVAHIPAMGPGGVTLGVYYQGAILPDGVPEDRIKHLLDAGMISAVDQVEPDASGQEQAGGSGGTPLDPPSSVNSRSSKGDLVEYGVAQGGNREELDALTRDQLIDRYVRKSE